MMTCIGGTSSKRTLGVRPDVMCLGQANCMQNFMIENTYIMVLGDVHIYISMY